MIRGYNFPSGGGGHKHKFTNNYLEMMYGNTDITLHSTSQTFPITVSDSTEQSNLVNVNFLDNGIMFRTSTNGLILLDDYGAVRKTIAWPGTTTNNLQWVYDQNAQTNKKYYLFAYNNSEETITIYCFNSQAETLELICQDLALPYSMTYRSKIPIFIEPDTTSGVTRVFYCNQNRRGNSTIYTFKIKNQAIVADSSKNLYSWSTSDGANSNFPDYFTIIKKSNYLYLFYMRAYWHGADCYMRLNLNSACDAVTGTLLKKDLRYYDESGTEMNVGNSLTSLNVFIANDKIYYSHYQTYLFELDESNLKWKQISNRRNLSDKTYVHSLPFFNLSMPYIVKKDNTYYRYNISTGSCSLTGTIDQTTIFPSSTQLYLPNVNILTEIGFLYFNNNNGASDGIYFKIIYEPTHSNGYYEPLTLKAMPDFH